MKFAAIDEAKYNVETPLIQFSTTRSIYFVNVTIGSPPVPQYLQIDTGSSLTWVRKSSDPPRQYFYNPDASHTFKYISCGDPICSSNSRFICLAQKTNHCGYVIMYMDMTKSSGVIGYDRFGFVNYTDPGNPSIVESVLFGALGNINNGTKLNNDPQYYGILGLGPESTSLVNHLPKPNTFRYCVENLSRANESQGYLFFGEVEGDYDDVLTTPIIQGYDHYIVEIVSICLDGVCLEIDPSVFKNVQGNVHTGVEIDTGSILSYLPDVAYDAVEQAVSKMMESKNKSKFPKKSSFLCYKGNLNDVFHEYYPFLTINFAGGGARMTITHTEYFYQLIPSLYCLSFRKTSLFGERYKNLTILGLQSQQHHVFEFDLDNWTMGIFGDTTCDVPL
ncbi:Peptidase A1 domain-containing protein [Heracleum sosnowskyi]|uniref:Peptidase A1 domain-containing protein n=1 Tax=Heracleum sosnowskyi TaxID=360622 RepID=A0AAD8MDZ0_9APIA|nr:Peptidase A1 domain-containing protein [Heracleum sosnowskyi]